MTIPNHGHAHCDLVYDNMYVLVPNICKSNTDMYHNKIKLSISMSPNKLINFHPESMHAFCISLFKVMW